MAVEVGCTRWVVFAYEYMALKGSAGAVSPLINLRTPVQDSVGGKVARVALSAQVNTSQTVGLASRQACSTNLRNSRMRTVESRKSVKKRHLSNR